MIVAQAPFLLITEAMDGDSTRLAGAAHIDIDMTLRTRGAYPGFNG
jgi:hypothetical protein